MFTTGSKLLIGAAVLATLSAIAYGVTQDGIMGTIERKLGFQMLSTKRTLGR